MKYIFLFILSFFYFNCFSQNLVPNPSFENYIICPYTDNIENAPPWYNPTSYALGVTPNLFNSCAAQLPLSVFGVPLNDAGYQYARTGKGYSGFAVFSDYQKAREYISVKLDSKLEVGKTYCVGFYASLSMCDSTLPNYGSMYAIDRMGAFLSDTVIHINTNYIIPAVPQIENPIGHFLSDTLNWMLISGTYIAHGGEKYITIGNFYVNDSTNYIQLNNSWSHLAFYYIDDVFVYKCDEVAIAEAGKDVSICKGDSVQIGMQTIADYKYKWLPAAGLNNDTISNPYASPHQTTTYYLYLNKYVETIDSVTVTVEICNDTTSSFFNVFPTLTTVQFYLDYRNIDFINSYFELIDICGRKVKEVKIENPTDKVTITTAGIAGGLYFYRLIKGKDVLYSGKIVVVN